FPWTNDPADGNAHVFFDDVRVRLNAELPAGAVLRLVWEAPAEAAYAIVDRVDAEWVEPPYPQPEGSLSILGFGAIADDGQDDSGAILACIAEAAKQGREVFLPAGAFEVSNPVLVQGIWLSQKGTVIRGAGMWHTTLTGPYAYFTFKNSNIALRDFSMIGRADLRRDTFPTAMTSDFNRFDLRDIDVSNVWVEHYNIGLWVNCIDRLHITGCRFRNTYADGVNLRRGTSNSVVEQCDFRNNGDDGIAQWSAAVSDRNNKIRFNTVSLPWLANNIAVYGGIDIEITDNLLRDTVSFGGGVNISTKFDPQPFAGVIRVARNAFERTGSRDWDIPKEYGAIWINTVEGFDNDATLIVQDNDILDSGYHGICFTGGGRLADARVEGNRIQGVALQPVYVDPPVRGQLWFGGNEGMSRPDGLEGSGAERLVTWQEERSIETNP
ncbi:MAG TPA: glycosyl hydrolase family 28-related protein, partial [Clostridia bacterium]|nr:glycosyl hydrolase family 28-related protein [Clostridia bacterium]